MSPVFSPDGSRIAYTTTADGGVTWNTWIVPVLGGQPRPFLKNAEGLTWVRPQNAVTGSPLVLFSEMTGRGWQMSIVSSTESRTSQQTIYMPSPTGMAHRSYLAPNRKQELFVFVNDAVIGVPGFYDLLYRNNRGTAYLTVKRTR